MLSLVKLYARSIWHTMMGGKGGLTIWGPDAEEHCMFSSLAEVSDNLIHLVRSPSSKNKAD